VSTTDGVDAAAEDPDLALVAERSLVADALRALSEDHRAVIAAAYWEGLDTRQIAGRLGVPDGTVKSRLYYGLRALRAALEEREVF
jgi:RNA polymerase sigma-70 factor (ECF subfamily)